MADKYVRSTDGDNADSGETWALAYANVATGANAVSAGEKVYVSQSHAETGTASITIASTNGTTANPIQLICSNDGGEPPSSTASTATVTITGAITSTMSFTGSFISDGINYLNTSSSSAAHIQFNNSSASANQSFRNCTFQMGTGVSARIKTASVVSASLCRALKFENVSFRFGSTSQRIQLIQANAELLHCSIDAAGSAITGLFEYLSGESRGCSAIVIGADLSAMSSASSLVAVSNMASPSFVRFVNCKLPLSASLITGSFLGPGPFVEAYNCDSGNTNYKIWRESFEGTLMDETTIVMTSGATEGSQEISWKLVSSAKTAYHGGQLNTPWIFVENTIIGSSKTATVEILHDSATNLKNDEIWLEIYYLSDSGSPLASLGNNAKSDLLATAADQPDSSQSWTTTGMSNPNNQKLTVAFTPQKAGLIGARVKLAKANKTVYINPDITIS